jgi:hypothetical protein
MTRVADYGTRFVGSPGFTPHIVFKEKMVIVVETSPGSFFVVGSSEADVGLAQKRLGCATGKACSTEFTGEVWEIERHPRATQNDSIPDAGPWPKVVYDEDSYLVAEVAPRFFRILAFNEPGFRAAALALHCGISQICAESRQGPAWTITRGR